MHVGWNQALETGNEVIDSLQLDLFHMASQLAEAAGRRNAAEARAHLARLGELARVLFESEEEALRYAGAPGLERHAGEHRRFLAELVEVAEALSPGAPLDLHAARHPVSWLASHAARTNRELGGVAVPSAAA